MYIKITKAQDWNWYKDMIGEIFKVKSTTEYEDLGVQIYRTDGGGPDVIQHGDYEYV